MKTSWEERIVTASLEKGLHYSIFPIVHFYLNPDCQVNELRKPRRKVKCTSGCVCEAFPVSLRPLALQSMNGLIFWWIHNVMTIWGVDKDSRGLTGGSRSPRVMSTFPCWLYLALTTSCILFSVSWLVVMTELFCLAFSAMLD